jgi:hypothetical protein
MNTMFGVTGISVHCPESASTLAPELKLSSNTAAQPIIHLQNPEAHARI